MINKIVNYNEIKTLISSLLLTCKDGVSIDRFQTLYKTDIKEEIPYKELGFCTLEQMLLSMKDAIDINYLRNGLMILSAKCDSSNFHLKDMINHQKRATPKPRTKRFNVPFTTKFKSPRQHVPEWKKTEYQQIKSMSSDIKDRLRTVLSNYPSGLESADLLRAYYNMYVDEQYQNDLSYRDYGYLTSDEMFSSDPDLFNIETHNSKIILYPKVLSNAIIMMNDTELDSNKVIGESYTPELIENFQFYVDDDLFVHVAIGEVYNPYNIWLIINEAALDELMNEIQEFYNGPILENWKLENRSLSLDHPVIMVDSNGVYNRAIIISLKGIDLIEVMCVDYGTTCVISQSQLFYLHKKFFALPTQAILASLNGIKPVHGTSWDSKASKEILEFVKDKKTLFAMIAEIENPTIDKMSIRLVDTRDPDEDICLNEVLIQKNLARSTVKEKVVKEIPHLLTPTSSGKLKLFDFKNKDSPLLNNTESTNGSRLFSATKKEGFNDKSKYSIPSLMDLNIEMSSRKIDSNNNENFANFDNKSVDDSNGKQSSDLCRWLRQLPPTSNAMITLGSEKCEDAFLMNAVMHIDAAAQSIQDKRNLIIPELKEDISDNNLEVLIMLNNCLRTLMGVKSILADVDKEK